MNKKILSLFAIILCACFVLVGCGSSNITAKNITKLAKQNAVTLENFAFASTTKVDFGENTVTVGYVSSHGLVSIKNTTTGKYGVWSYAENKKIIECDHAEDALSIVNGVYCDYIIVKVAATETTEESYSVLAQNGTTIFSELENIPVYTPYHTEDKFAYEGWSFKDEEGKTLHQTIYRVFGLEKADRKEVWTSKIEKGDTITNKRQSLITNPILVKAVAKNQKLETYTFEIITNTDNTESVCFYNAKGKAAGTLTYNEEKMEYGEMIFTSSHVYWQEFTELSEDATKYDVYDSVSNKKYNFKTFVFNIKNGKTTELKFNSIIDDVVEVMGEADFTIVKANSIEHNVKQTGFNYFFAQDGKLKEAEYAILGATKTNKGYIVQTVNNLGQETYNFLDKNCNLITSINTVKAKVEVHSIMSTEMFAIMDNDPTSITYRKYAFVDAKATLLTGFEYDGVISMTESGYCIATKTETTMSGEEEIETTTYYRVNEKAEATEFGKKTYNKTTFARSYTLGTEEVIYFDVIDDLGFGYVAVTGTAGNYTCKLYNTAGTEIGSVTEVADYMTLSINPDSYMTVGQELSMNLLLTINDVVYKVA